MDVASSTASTLYQFQAALAGGSQGQAVLGALTRAYAQGSGEAGGLEALAGAANQAPLVSAIVSQAQAVADGAQGGRTAGIPGFTPSSVYGGLDSNTASALVSSLASSSSAGLGGFGTAVAGTGSLAAVGAQARQAYGSGTLTAAARTQAEALLDAARTQDQTRQADLNQANILQAAQAVQNATTAGTFSLLA